MRRATLVRPVVVVVVASLAFLAALSPSAAGAALSSQPDDTYITNGTVDTVARTNSTIYLGGSFSEVFPRTGPLAAVSTSTGALAESFPEVAGGSIDAIIPDGGDGYFIGGNFTHVGGVAIYGLAHILPDHTLDTNWNAGVSPGVVISALGLEKGILYVGIGLYGSEPSTNYVGDLGNGAITRYYMAALNAANAQATAWAPNLNGSVYSVLTTPTRIYIGGEFSAANGAVRSHLAALDPAVNLGASQTLAWNPEMSNGVSAYPAAISGSTVYIAGIFYEIGGVSRNGIAAVDAVSGALDTDWNPDPGSGFVSTVAVSGSNVYLGGGFYTLEGQTRNYAGEVTAATSPTSVASLEAWNPDPNGSVGALAVSGSTVYLGGSFSGTDDIGGSATRNHVAAVDTTNGTPTSWNPDPSGAVVAIFPAASTVTIAGGFAGVGGVARSNVAAFDAGTGAVTGWNPDVNGTVKALVPDGSKVYLGGEFAGPGSVNAGSEVIRVGLAAVDATSGQLLSGFNPQEIPDVQALLLSGGTLYVGGSFSGVIGQGVYRSYLAAVDADTGTVTSWNPPALNEEVNALALSGTTLYVGGNFTKAGTSGRANAAAFDTGSGALRGWNPSPDGIVYALAASNSTVYLGGYFANVDSTPRAGVAAVDTTEGALQAWNPALTQTSGPPNVSAIALEGEEVYLGGDFDAVQGTPRVHVAQVSASTGAASSWNPDPTPDIFDVPVDAIATDGHGGIVIGGHFTSMALANQAYLASFSAPPANTGAPSVSGTPAAGSVINCATGSWSGSIPQSYAVQWLRDGAAISGATTGSYTVASGDAGHALSCQVTATNLGGSSAVISPSVTVVAGAPNNISLFTNTVTLPTDYATLPSINGTPLPGRKLSCSPGTWTGTPTSFTTSWQLAGKTIPGATTTTYTVTIADEATGPTDGLTCTVVARNANGSSSPVKSKPRLVAIAGTLECPLPSGSLKGIAAGPLKLGMTRKQAHRQLKRFKSTRHGFENFCLYGGWGINAGYASARLAHRGSLQGRLVLALTSNPHYAIKGVHPGTSGPTAVRTLKLGRVLKIEATSWYLKVSGRSTEVLKVQHGVVQEIGLADRALTKSRGAEASLLRAFPQI